MPVQGLSCVEVRFVDGVFWVSVEEGNSDSEKGAIVRLLHIANSLVKMSIKSLMKWAYCGYLKIVRQWSPYSPVRRKNQCCCMLNELYSIRDTFICRQSYPTSADVRMERRSFYICRCSRGSSRGTDHCPLTIRYGSGDGSP